MVTKHLAASVYGSSPSTLKSLKDDFKQAFKIKLKYKKGAAYPRYGCQKTIEILSTKKRTVAGQTKLPQTMAKCELYGNTDSDLAEVERNLESAFPKTKWVYCYPDPRKDPVDIDVSVSTRSGAAYTTETLDFEK